jgi:hypothetical protein
VEAEMTAKECEKRAEECLELMCSATAENKDTLRRLAQDWLILADQARVYEGKAPVPQHA